jgi:hypothetical protein
MSPEERERALRLMVGASIIRLAQVPGTNYQKKVAAIGDLLDLIVKGGPIGWHSVQIYEILRADLRAIDSHHYDKQLLKDVVDWIRLHLIWFAKELVGGGCYPKLQELVERFSVQDEMFWLNRVASWAKVMPPD